MTSIRATNLIVLGTFLALSGCANHAVHVSKPHDRLPSQPAPKHPQSLPLNREASKQAAKVEQVSFEPKQVEELPAVTQVDRQADENLAWLEETAIANNPALAEAHARVQAVCGRWLQAGLPANPMVGYSGQQLGSGGTAEQHGVLVGQEFIRHQKRMLSRAVVEREIRIAQQQWSAQHQRVLTDVRIAYYTFLAAQQHAELAKEISEVARKASGTTSDLFESGDVGKSAKLQARVESETAQIRLENSQNEQRAAWRNLMAIVGTPSEQLRPIPARLSHEIPELVWEEVRDRLWCHSPEMASALLEIERARRAVDRARVEKRPNLELEGVLQVDHATNSINGNVVAKVPLPILNRNQGRVRETKAELSAAKAAVQRVELDLQQRLATVFQRYQNARNQVERFTRKDGILESSKDSLNTTIALYENNDVGFLDQLTAQRTFFQTNLTYIAALREMWTAVAEIDGLLLRGSLRGE